MNARTPLLETRINNASRQAGIREDLVADLLAFAYAARRKKPACVDVLVVDDAEISRLNRRHLGHDCPTDVLSFEDGDDEDGRLRLGDIAVSAETAGREAAERGVDPSHELAFYALHGLFHLLGMDDATEADREKMLKAQAKAMRDFGLEPGDGLL